MPNPYVVQLWKASLLMDAGFPAGPDLYEMEFWQDLGLFRRMLAAHTMTGPMG